MGFIPIKGATVRGPRGDVTASFMKASLRRQNQQWDFTLPKEDNSRMAPNQSANTFPPPYFSPHSSTPLSTFLHLISNPMEARDHPVRG